MNDYMLMADPNEKKKRKQLAAQHLQAVQAENLNNLASAQEKIESNRMGAIFGKGTKFREAVAERDTIQKAIKSGTKAERLADAGKATKAAKGVSGASKAAGAISGAKDLMEMEGTGNTGSDVASGAMSGASAGMAFGPKGAIIGGLVGAGMGILKSKSARKAAARKAFNEFQDTRAKIAGDKADREREAFSFLGQAFSQSLL